DPHNISAVMRTADAVGVIDIYLVHPPSGRYRKFGNFGKKSSASASKWLRVHQFEEVSTCMQQLKDQGFTILATHLGAASSSLYSLDLTQRVALVFGNEHAGVSEPCLAYCDGNFVIPQVGF